LDVFCAKTKIAENSTRKHHTMFTRIVQAAAVGGGWAECGVQGRREMTITNADQAYDDLIEISARSIALSNLTGRA
jgi:hypothetical protein